VADARVGYSQTGTDIDLVVDGVYHADGYGLDTARTRRADEYCHCVRFVGNMQVLPHIAACIPCPLADLLIQH
jgi:hypothetical protein